MHEGKAFKKQMVFRKGWSFIRVGLIYMDRWSFIRVGLICKSITWRHEGKAFRKKRSSERGGPL